MQKFCLSEESDISASRYWYFVTWMVLALGFILRLRDFLYVRSLWLDEGRLGVSFLDRSISTLFATPLEYDQAAPPGFLIVVKIITAIFGTTDITLRLFPFLLGCLFPLCIYLAAREVLKSGAATAFCVSLASFGIFALRYTNEAKPYAVDFSLAALLVWLALRYLKSGKGMGILAIIGTLSIWFSYPSIFILAGFGSVLLWIALREKHWHEAVRLVGCGVLWISSFALNYVLFTVENHHRVVDIVSEPGKHWSAGWMPFPPNTLTDWFWLPNNIFHITEIALSLDPWHRVSLPLIAGGLAVAVFVGLILSREYKVSALILSPYAIALCAAALHSYPIYQRAALFLVPFAILAAGIAVRALWSTKNFGLRMVSLIVVGMSLVPALVSSGKYLMRPREVEELKKVLHRMEPSMHNEQKFYVYYGATPPFRIYDSEFNQPEDSTIFGTENRDHPQYYINEIMSLGKAPEVWVIISHNWVTPLLDEEHYIISTLASQWKLITKVEETGAAAYLFDTRERGTPIPVQ